MTAASRRSWIAVSVLVAVMACPAWAKSVHHCTCAETNADHIRSLDDERLPHPFGEGFPRTAFSHLSDREVELLQEYWTAADLLVAFYSNILVQGEVVRRVATAGQRLTPDVEPLRSEFTYWAAGGSLFRVDQLKHAKGDAPAEWFVAVIGPEGESFLGRDPATGQAFLKMQSRDRGEALWNICRRSLHHVAYTDYDQLTIAHDLFFDARYSSTDRQWKRYGQIASVEDVQDDDGARLVRITHRSFSDPESQTRYDLLPDYGWVVRRFQRDGRIEPQGDDPDGSVYRQVGECTYRSGVDGIGLVASCRREEWRGESRDFASLVPTETYEVVFKELIPGAPPLDTFDVDALLGRKRLVVAEQRTSWWWVLLLNGFALFLIGGYLLRRRRRRRRGENSGA